MICAFYNEDMSQIKWDNVDDLNKLDAGFKRLLPRLGIVKRVMNTLNLTVNRDLLSLLACWSDIVTHDQTSLYRQMFLNPSLLKQDAVFADNGYGEFLSDSDQKIISHSEALRSAFNLTEDEFKAACGCAL